MVRRSSSRFHDEHVGGRARVFVPDAPQLVQILLGADHLVVILLLLVIRGENRGRFICIVLIMLNLDGIRVDGGSFSRTSATVAV